MKSYGVSARDRAQSRDVHVAGVQIINAAVHIVSPAFNPAHTQVEFFIDVLESFRRGMAGVRAAIPVCVEILARSPTGAA